MSSPTGSRADAHRDIVTHASDFYNEGVTGVRRDANLLQIECGTLKVQRLYRTMVALIERALKLETYGEQYGDGPSILPASTAVTSLCTATSTRRRRAVDAPHARFAVERWESGTWLYEGASEDHFQAASLAFAREADETHPDVSFGSQHKATGMDLEFKTGKIVISLRKHGCAWKSLDGEAIFENRSGSSGACWRAQRGDWTDAVQYMKNLGRVRYEFDVTAVDGYRVSFSVPDDGKKRKLRSDCWMDARNAVMVCPYATGVRLGSQQQLRTACASCWPRALVGPCAAALHRLVQVEAPCTPATAAAVLQGGPGARPARAGAAGQPAGRRRPAVRRR